MPSATIIIRQGDLNNTPGSRDDLILGASVTVLNNEIGVSSYFWQFIDIPEGSTVVLSTPTHSSSTFTPDMEGTYLIRLTINSGPGRTIFSQAGAAVKTANLHFRIPAVTEDGEFNIIRGWGQAVNEALKIIDDGYGNLEEDNDGLFYPKDFGAFGDGIHNDSVAWQAMLNAIKAVGGGIVHLPNEITRAPQTFLLSTGASVDLAAAKASIKFIGGGSQIICGTGTSTPSLEILNSAALSTTASLITFDDVHLTGGLLSNSIGIHIDNMNVRMEQASIIGLDGYSFQITNALSVDLDQVLVDMQSVTGNAFVISGIFANPPKATIRASQIHVLGGATGARAFNVDSNILDFRISQCVFENGAEASKSDLISAIITRVESSRFSDFSSNTTSFFLPANLGFARSETVAAAAPVDQFSLVVIDPANVGIAGTPFGYKAAPITANASEISGVAGTAASNGRFILDHIEGQAITVLSDGYQAITAGDFLKPSPNVAGRVIKTTTIGEGFIVEAIFDVSAVLDAFVVGIIHFGIVPGAIPLANGITGADGLESGADKAAFDGLVDDRSLQPDPIADTLSTFNNTPVIIPLTDSSDDAGLIVISLLIQAQSDDSSDVFVSELRGTYPGNTSGQFSLLDPGTIPIYAPHSVGAAAWATVLVINNNLPSLSITGDSTRQVNWSWRGTLSRS